MAARFSNPGGLATDSAGNVYVADTDNDTIRKITPAGVVSTFAGTAGISGSADGRGAVARFSGPQAVATDSAGNVYVADTGNHAIRKVTPAGLVSTLAGTTYDPTGVAVDGSGNVYVADTLYSDNVPSATILKITPAGMVSTFAGTPYMVGSSDGTGPAASFLGPRGLATDSAGNVYVADADNYRPFHVSNNTIRKITPAGAVTTLAGMAGTTGSTDGVGAAASFNEPAGIGVDNAGNVYVADTGNNLIRKITPTGVVTTIVGRPGEFGFEPGPLPGLLSAPQSVALFDTTLYTTTNNAIVQVSNVP
jgi:sugar lactone lactonase YvrE